ncbi:MAG: class II fructose-bisphosphate aldolase [Vulcanimicrobiaceae bacterium]
MERLRGALERSERDRVGVGHFNVSDIVALRAIFAAARELQVPVLIGASEGERAFIGVRQIAALVKSLRDEYDYPIFLNADHTHTLEHALEAARAGFDEVLFDGSSLDFETNVKRTKEAVEAIKSVDPEIIVEGEVGYIGTSSAILDTAPAGVGNETTPDEAKQFVEETKVDVFAPAVGNMHGMLRSMVSGETQQYLDIHRIRKIKAATGAFLTLHGASGTNDADLAAAIEAGINIIHINTELRLAWRRGVESALREHPDEVVPYKLLTHAFRNIESVTRARLQLFNSTSRTAAPPASRS